VSEGDFSSSSNATSLTFKTGSSEAAAEKVRINSSGNVKVLTGNIQLGASGSETGQIEINSTRLLLRSTGDASGLRFDGSAYTPFKNGSQADGTVDLGSSSGKYKDLYLGGGLFVGGTGSANKLDDYEEGTFTAAFSAGSGTVTIDDSFKTGVYTKIGSVVTFTLHARVASVSGNSGSLTITGLPFTTPNDTKYRHTIGVTAYFVLTGMTNLELPFAYLSSNSSTLNLAITNTNNLQALPADRVTTNSEFYITGSYQVTS